MNKKRNIWLRMVSYLKPYLGWVVASMVLAVFVNVAEILNPYVTKLIIDDYIVARNTDVSVVILGAVYFGTVVISGICAYAQYYILNLTGQKIIHQMRMEVFTNIQHMRLSYFDNNSGGSVLTKVTNDIEAISELYSGVIVGIAKDLFMLIGIVVTMLWIDVQMALVSFSIIPIIIIVTILYNKKAKENFRWVRRLIANINGFFAENLQGMRIVQVYNRQKEKYDEFSRLNDEYNKANKLQVRLNALFRPVSEMINSLAISILIWYCAQGIYDGVIQIGVLYAFITYSKKFFNPINDLTDKYSSIQAGVISAERIFEVLDDAENIEDMETGKPMRKVVGKVEFRNVWFSYNDVDWVLKDLSFMIQPGETVAFVGSTGAGKSTIINLISRFYDVQRGDILIDDVNIREINLADLRRSVAVVMQDVFLFAGDIASNIRLNDSSITDEDVVNAAEYVNANSFIEQLRGGYSAEVKERGATLSAGQRQLLSFARSVAFQPDILVLDEATANIDTQTEQIIQQSLLKISENRTTIVVAHRLSTIKNADRIFVIGKGRIIESGTHDELVDKNGVYRKLYEIQFKQ